MAGSGGGAVVPTNADLAWAIADGALGQPASGTDQAATIGVDSATLVGTGATVQAVFEEMDNAIATSLATNDTQDTALAAVLVEDAVNLAYRPKFSHLTADSAARNATTTLLDSGLTVTLAAGTYEIDSVVMVITAAAADISFKWDGTATITGTVGTSDIVKFGYAAVGSDGTVAGLAALLPTSWTTEVETMFATTGAFTALPVLFKGIIVCTVAGTLKLQFTQGTSDASDTKIKAGSWLKAQKVA